MFGLSLIHLIVPVVIVLWALNSRRYERNTRLLVERERAKAMLALKNSQQSERDEAFQRQQSLIGEAKTRLLAQRAAEASGSAKVETANRTPKTTANSTPQATANSTPKATDHRVEESVWSYEEPPVELPETTMAQPSNATIQKNVPRPAGTVEEHVIEGVYTSDEAADADNIH